MKKRDVLGTPLVGFANHPVLASTSATSLISSVVCLFFPHELDSTAISQFLGVLLPLWLAVYIVASAAVLAGLAKSLRLEAVGLSLMFGAVMIEGVSLIAYHGIEGAISAAPFIGLGLGVLGRLRVLLWLLQEAQHEAES